MDPMRLRQTPPHPARAYLVEQIEPRDRIRSPLHSLPHTGTAAATVLRQYVHRRPRARRECLRAGGLEWFCLFSGVPGFHECNRFRHRQGRRRKGRQRWRQIRGVL